MKNIEINVNFDKIKNYLDDTEKQYQQYYTLPSSENIFKEAGFKGGVLLYTILGDKLNNEDFLYLAIDYVARVCWAFHSQNKIDFLRVYKETFFDFKISKTTKEIAFGKLLNFEQNHKYKSHGLVDLFGYCSAFYERQSNDLYFWCDGLRIIKSKALKGKIGIKYNISEDQKTRALLNPIKFNLFNWPQSIEHIASLNLIISLSLEAVKENKEQTKNYIDIINNSWDYFIDNPRVLDTPQQSNNEVYKLLSGYRI